MRTDPVENNLLDYVKRLSKKIRRIDHSETRVDRLSDITDKAGTFSDIEIRANADPSDPKDIGDGFTGAFLSGQGQTFNGELWGMGTVIDDELQAGLAMDGKIKAGAGAVVLDADGIEVIVDDIKTDGKSYKLQNENGETVGRLAGLIDVGGDESIIYLEAIGNAGETNARLTLSATDTGSNEASISLDTQNAGTSTISLTATNILLSSSSIAYGAGTSSGVIYSGTYTPTLTNTTNIAASTALLSMYFRLGNMVFVSGQVAIDPTATGAIVLGMTLPIAKTFSNYYDLAGNAISGNSETLRVMADTTNHRAYFSGIIASDVANRAFGFNFMYSL